MPRYLVERTFPDSLQYLPIRKHHLASIFAKLDVGTGAEAVSAAHRLGVISETR